MTISIIICTRDRADALRQTLAAFAALDIPRGVDCELVVVDNGSSDDTALVVQECRLPCMAVRYAFEGQAGQSRARNLGLALAAGETIVFTDDDVRPPPDWLARLCAPLWAGEADAVGGGVHLAAGAKQAWMEPVHRLMLASTEDLPLGTALPSMLGANMAFARRVLARVPGFDPELGPGRLGFCDDSLFCLQLREAGFRIATALDVVVEHHPDPARITPQSFMVRVIKEGQSQAYVSYHWEHDTCTHDEGTFPEPTIRHVRLTLLRRLLALAGLRLTRGRARRQSQTAPDWELRKLRQIAFYRQYLVEQRRPRAYDRRGLVKKPPLVNGTATGQAQADPA